MRTVVRGLQELRRYPSAILGLLLVGLLVGVSLYAVIGMPYSEAIHLWRAGVGVWDEYPRNARPVWTDLFTRERLPRTIVVRSGEDGRVASEPTEDGTRSVEIVLPFDFQYDGFPREITLFVDTQMTEGEEVRYTVVWRTPGEQEMTLTRNRRVRRSDVYRISQDGTVRMALPGMPAPEVGLLADLEQRPGPEGRTVVKGSYEVLVRAEIPADAELTARLVVYGQIAGLAGTDHRRRDLMVALLWGAPLALAFGFLGAVGANVSTFVLAGIGTWYGGKTDSVFQRLTELFMVLPLLPVLIMVGHFFSRSLWLMLGLIIVMSVFSGAMKTYRAMFLQAREAPYIEAAQAYGAGNMRIVFRYLLPRIAPVLLPQFVLVIPTFVFLEATLAVIGLGDPVLPTWGKVMNDALGQGALYKGYYYWMVQPAVLLMVTGFGFALLGYSLDRVFNPRLRGV